MEERPCPRCGNEAAPYFDDEPNAPYRLTCLAEDLRAKRKERVHD